MPKDFIGFVVCKENVEYIDHNLEVNKIYRVISYFNNNKYYVIEKNDETYTHYITRFKTLIKTNKITKLMKLLYE